MVGRKPAERVSYLLAVEFHSMAGGCEMKQIAALYVAQAKEFLRDRTSLIFVLLLPVAFGVFFGLVFSGGGGFTLQLGVVNEDAGPAGAEFVAKLQSPEAAQGINVRVGSRAEMLALL